MEQNTQPTNELLNTQPTPQMPADSAAASLAFATNMSDHMLTGGQGIQQQPTEGPTEPQNKATQTPTTDNTKGMEDRIMKEIDSLRGEISNKNQKDEIDAIRKDLIDLLKEDGE